MKSCPNCKVALNETRSHAQYPGFYTCAGCQVTSFHPTQRAQAAKSTPHTLGVSSHSVRNGFEMILDWRRCSKSLLLYCAALISFFAVYPIFRPEFSYSDIPGAAQVIFGGMVLIALLTFVIYSINQTRIRVDEKNITIRTTPLSFHPKIEIPIQEIQKIGYAEIIPYSAPCPCVFHFNGTKTPLLFAEANERTTAYLMHVLILHFEQRQTEISLQAS